MKECNTQLLERTRLGRLKLKKLRTCLALTPFKFQIFRYWRNDGANPPYNLTITAVGVFRNNVVFLSEDMDHLI